MNLKGIVPRTWRKLKKLIIILVILQFVYILLLRWINPPITITQLDSWVTGHGLKRDYVSSNEISPMAKLAVIASEDQLYVDHNGFDWKSIERAMSYNKKGEKVRGGSTISQQVAKNVFLWQGRSWVRKALEAYFTFMIELCWSKERILDVYLNVIEMGDGVFGVEAASQTYFNKPAKDLTKKEAAIIASCLPNPKVYTVNPMCDYVNNRYPAILKQMNNLTGKEDIQVVIENKKVTVDSVAPEPKKKSTPKRSQIKKKK